MGGRRPKPAALRLLQGNPSRRKVGPEVTAPAELPVAPDYVTGRALAEWEDLGSKLLANGLMTALDTNGLGCLCVAIAALKDAQDAIALTGATYVTSTGFVRPSPHTGMRDRAIKLVAQLSNEFGLTPAARTKVHHEQQPIDDAFERYLKRGPN